MANMNHSELLFNSFLKTAENIICHFDNDKDERNSTLNSLEEIVKNNCVYDEKIKKVQSTIKELINSASADNTDSDEIMKVFNERKGELIEYQPDISQHQNYIEFKRQVQDIVNDMDGTGSKKATLDDDDIEMTQDEINVIDPFTKRQMTNPVKNKVCGHVYDQESVTEMIKMNKNTRCPVVGCINKNPILESELVADIRTRKYLHENKG